MPTVFPRLRTELGRIYGRLVAGNLWHDSTAAGDEVPSGVNPMWHAKNLENGITPDYLEAYGLDPSDPKNQLTGVYDRHYDATLVAPWLWNDRKKVFLTTEDEESLTTKVKYVKDKGIGGVMFWEMAGDYALDQSSGQYFMGTTMVDTIDSGLKGAAPYGNTKATGTRPANVLDVGVELTGFALGEANYPINPGIRLTNRTAQQIPSGARIEFGYGTSAPGSMVDQSGLGLRVPQQGHRTERRRVEGRLPARVLHPAPGDRRTGHSGAAGAVLPADRDAVRLQGHLRRADIRPVSRLPARPLIQTAV
ncbi:chitinase [Kibdelosporangium phytohabitans]|uniref:GH18 domain-containing protein n=1 Tax=Kibdelosporangium phytohabitans TaxID=860235 RepID=A0A0N9I744_9PSEU|nr:hypothetical protein AOZ06_38175 [Kibdelosporangium phytohabitans]MBE1463377.1 chitinase [Kibdelosporangium phytohabitans]